MIVIPEFDQVLSGEIDYKELNPNHTLFDAYRSYKTLGNELLDINGVIWDNQIDEIVTFLISRNIHEITISSTFSGLIRTLALMDEHGFKVVGLAKVNAPYTDWITGSWEQIDALKLVYTKGATV